MITRHAGAVRVIGRMCKVVGDAGEEALAATMVQRWNVKADNILGYSNHPAIANRFGLTNKSGHGLDMLVYLPPPPTLTVRAPTSDAMRHSMDGMNGTLAAPTQTLAFNERTLVVIEVKATLGGTRTPGFNRTQGVGGAGKVSSILALIKQSKGHWKRSNVLAADTNAMRKAYEIEQASLSGNIQYLHAQVFFDHRGHLSTLTGNGSGIQINLW